MTAAVAPTLNPKGASMTPAPALAAVGPLTATVVRDANGQVTLKLSDGVPDYGYSIDVRFPRNAFGYVAGLARAINSVPCEVEGFEDIGSVASRVVDRLKVARGGGDDR